MGPILCMHAYSIKGWTRSKYSDVSVENTLLRWHLRKFNILVALLATYEMWDDHDKDLSNITPRYMCWLDTSMHMFDSWR